MAVHRVPRLITHARGVKVKSYSVIRAVWHAVVGELGGNVDLQASKRMRAPSRIAAYLSKYMTKAFADGDAWSNRFSSSKTVTVPKPQRIRFVGWRLGDVAATVFDDLPPYISEQLLWGMTRFKDGIWFILDTNIPMREPTWEELERGGYCL
jgi:hypothetical protein